MHALRSRTVLRRLLASLLWLALLLPMAQLAASCHALSHARLDGGGAADPQYAPHQARCDLCLTAAAIFAGAPPGEPPSLAPVTIRYAPPRFALITLWVASPARAYLSRAPPIASR